MNRIFILICLSSACLFGQSGQGSNTIFQQFFANQNLTTAVPSAPARAVGQQYHRIDVFASSTGPNACLASASGLLQLEGSADNVTYVGIGVPITSLQQFSINNSPSNFLYATTGVAGAYAYVRAEYVVPFGDATLCTITVNYSGSVTGTPTGSAPYTSWSDSFTTLVGSQSATAAALLVNCPYRSPLQLYMISLSAPGGVNTATLQMRYVNIGTVWTFKFPLAATGVTVMPQGSRPYFLEPYLGPIGEQSGIYSLYLSLSAATEVDYAISYRCE